VLCTVSSAGMCLFAHNVSDILYIRLPLSHYLLLGFLNAFFAVYSDLLESFLKRCAGVKVNLFSDYFNFSIGFKRSPPWSWWAFRSPRFSITSDSILCVVYLYLLAPYSQQQWITPPQLNRYFLLGLCASK
jgi:hypothetical protein